ncbi:porin [Candidatus Margulisiibacteriota bacterium]
MNKFFGLMMLLLFAVSTVSYAVEVGGVNMNGDFRFRYTNNEAAGINDSMTVARARIKLSGNVTEDLSLVIQPDFAGLATGGAVGFAGAWADLKCKKGFEHTLRCGQFYIPFSLGAGSYKTIVYPAHYNVIVPDRDYGLALMTKVMEMDLALSLTNGNGSGADNNKAKDLSVKVVTDTPVGKVGLSGYYGKNGAAMTEQKDAGIYLLTQLSDVDLIAEYVIGGAWGGTGQLSNTYLTASMKIDDLEPLVQYQIYDVNTATSGNIVNTLTIGINKYLADNGSRMMLNYNIIGEETGSIANNTLIAQLRVKI